MTLAAVLIAVSTIFLVSMYVAARSGDRYVKRRGRLHHHRLVYPLALGVFFSAWAFFGAGGATAAFGGAMIPLLTGAFCSLIIWPVLAGRMTVLSKRHRLISLAHFLSFRHGDDRNIAFLVTALCATLVVTYAALQIGALDAAAQILIANWSTASAAPDNWQFWTLSMIVTGLTVFCLAMVGKSSDTSVSHPGLMFVLAVKAVLKLAVLFTVAIVMTVVLLPDLQSGLNLDELSASFSTLYISPEGWVAAFLLGAAAILLLPHQYQAAVIENVEWRDLWYTLPVLGLFLLALVVVSFGLGALAVHTGAASAGRLPLFVLDLPLRHGLDSLAIATFIGGLAAAAGLLALGTLTVATMVCEDVVIPFLGYDRSHYRDETPEIQRIRLLVRRGVIVILIAFSAGFYQLLDAGVGSGLWGIIPLIGAVQLLPGFLGALFWPSANRTGLLAGLGGGIAVWAYTCWIPVLVEAGAINPAIMDGVFGWSWTRPDALFGMEGQSILVHGTFWTLLVNIGLYVSGGLIFGRNEAEVANAEHVIYESGLDVNWLEGQCIGGRQDAVTVGDLLMLAGRYLGEEEARTQFERYTRQLGGRLDESHPAVEGHFFFTERLLAAVLGSTGAKVIMASVLEEKGGDNVADMFDKAGEAMEASRAVIRATLESMDHGIAVIDSNFLVVGWNRKQEDLLGPYRNVLKVGAHFADILRTFGQLSNTPVEQTEARIQQLIDHFKRGEPIAYERELQDGRCYEIRWSPLPDGAWSVITADMSAQKQTQQQLIDAKEAAELANRSKSEFLANMSHELRTPLNAIIGFSEIISEQLFGPVGNRRYVRYAQNIQQSGNLLLQLIGDILDLSKVEIGNIDLKEEPVALAELVEACTTIVRERARKAEVAVEVDIPDSLPRIHCDPTRMKQVVLNLLSNAVKFNRPGGTVSLRAKQDVDGLRVDVVDTGIGMSREEIDVAVTRFGRADRVLQDAYEGTGLGLPLAIKLTELQGGTLDIESTPDVGTRITIRLPADRLVKGSAAA